MTRWKFWWLTLGILLAVPYVFLFAAGSVWLYERGLLLEYMGATVAITAAAMAVMHWMRVLARRRAAVGDAPVPLGFPRGGEPDPAWPPLARRAWDEVEAIARRVEGEDLPLDQPDRIGEIFHEVLRAVARQYHPQAAEPELETPLPQVLWAVERVARDLREAFSENVPGAHVLTLGDFWRLKRLAQWYRQAYFLYRLASAGFNPISAIMREIRDAAANKMLTTSTGDLKQWAVGYCVRRAGWYAIELYSQARDWDQAALEAFRTPESRRDAERAAARAEPLTAEPLRVLVAGQVKSGKSSVINALFGEVRSAVDVVPCTRNVEPYLLERDGMPLAIVLDTAGYESVDAADLLAPVEKEMLRCDLVLLVVTAVSAARQADRRLLDQLRDFYGKHPERTMPPVVAVVTHIDLVRPAAEWNPPYDLAHPQNAKAANIAEAVRTIAADLALGEGEQIVPVCLKPQAEYNVEEGLVPAILELLPKAKAACYLRCLRRFREATHWQRLWRQTLNAGRVLWHAGKSWLARRKT